MPEIKDITTQEIDDFITQNNLDPKDKFMFRILRSNYMNSSSSADHIKDKELHTAKGLLLKANVMALFIFFVILISTVVCYLPEKIAMLSP